jgi:glutamyl-tRNA synthetase
MGINEVIRGDDHLSNTPKQIVVYEALGFTIPAFYHVPMIHNSKGKKLSKRDGATDVMEYKEMGYTPEALLNFLVRLGWSHGDQEIFSMEEMQTLFDPKDINKSASIYSTDKLDWLNAHYIKNTPNATLTELLTDYGVVLTSHDKKEILLDSLKERAKTLVELAKLIKEVTTTPTTYDEKAVKKAFKGNAIEVLNAFGAKVSSADELKLPLDYHTLMESVVNEMEIGFGKIGNPLRVALLGKMSGPGLDSVMAVLGKEETMLRIANAISALS